MFSNIEILLVFFIKMGGRDEWGFTRNLPCNEITLLNFHIECPTQKTLLTSKFRVFF